MANLSDESGFNVLAVASSNLTTSLYNLTTSFSASDVDFEAFLYNSSMSLVAATTKQQRHSLEMSPVTLSSTWSPLSRLLLLSILSILGSVGNIFMISAVMIEDHLNKAGNAFIVNIALADLLVTLLVMPSSIIGILASIEDDHSMCRIQHFLNTSVFIVTVLSILVTAVENYIRLCKSRDDGDPKGRWFNKANTTAVLILLWCIGFSLSGFQFANTSFEYCRKKPNQILPPGVAVLVTISLVPLFITFLIFLRIKMKIQKRLRQPNFKPNSGFNSDLSLAKTNFFSFVIFILFWMPFAIVLSLGTTKFAITNYMFYNCAWVGISKSCFYNIIYCLTHRHFRNAYANLFNYCCCKTTVSSSSRRHRNDGGGANRPTSDVRVHIIPGYNMYSYTSPQRSTSGGHWGGKRDIHEL